LPDPYEIIGVRQDASLDEIRIAYRRSAQVLHPDRFATASEGVRAEAAHRMLQLNSAMQQIEQERGDEASGTGGLGHVAFDERPAPPVPTERSGPLGERARAAAAQAAATAPPADEAPKPAAEPVAEPVAASTSEELVRTREPVRQAAPEPEPAVEEDDDQAAPSPYGLGVDPGFGVYEDDDYEEEEPARPLRRRREPGGAGRSRLPLVLAGVVIVAAVAVIAGYFALRGGGPGDQQFQRANAPFSFKYPATMHPRTLAGGVALNKPTYQVGFGLGPNDYLMASTYRLGFTVQDDGSATGPKGQTLTPTQIDHDIDVTIAKLASQAGLSSRAQQSGSLGPLRARIYDYAKQDGSLMSTFVVALDGNTEYYVTCQSTPANQDAMQKACNRLLQTFVPA
jgi:hypothetical protein